jgi:PTS system nitrogen regulatory IIA component
MSLDLSDLLVPELVMTGVVAANPRALFAQVAGAAAPILGVEPKALADALAAREKLGSTGFGGGVAIPHAKLPELPRIALAVARLASPIEFRAVDDVPVDLAFTLFSPAGAGTEHLKALARVSRRLRDRAFVAKLRGAGSRDALWALLSADEARDAA